MWYDPPDGPMCSACSLSAVMRWRGGDKIGRICQKLFRAETSWILVINFLSSTKCQKLLLKQDNITLWGRLEFFKDKNHIIWSIYLDIIYFLLKRKRREFNKRYLNSGYPLKKKLQWEIYWVISPWLHYEQGKEFHHQYHKYHHIILIIISLSIFTEFWIRKQGLWGPRHHLEK